MLSPNVRRATSCGRATGTEGEHLMRAIWSGAVSFGLVSVPIKVYSATSNHDVRFHQVHGEDGGRIRYKRTCEVCGEEVSYADIVKGFETPEGELITLDENDLASLPVATGHEIDVIEFVPNEQIDPMLFDKSYYLEPETKAAKPYALLREALNETDRTAVVKVALRQRETLALLRVRDKAIVLQTLIWPDEVRTPDFDILETDVELRPQELQMASSLVESMGADFDGSEFHDEYRDAMVDLIEAKKSDGDARPAPAAERADDGADSMSDLLSALQASVDAARTTAGTKSGGSTGGKKETAATGSGSRSSSGTKSSGSSTRSRSRKSTEEKETAATGTEGGGTKPATTRRRSTRKTA
ncbi:MULTISPECIES: Ku protein [unclassified Pseudonocardia]|uniref:non-homologous end joining protein Ku n=2 Tax=Pseudonocardia TaxID=1847 RepID=UPI00096628CA|nr:MULTISPECIES: Ku protein [unclassified Pseudonocardia]OLL76565.1 Ku domain protein [Pseudonocardia sp. Ae150A_Ps1]OLL83311.1 Ku domain protein [Pseudonocardia sp. Ae263_Ps1]OLL90651.1 Ku domain protein [Pseudonocardia sp. Ae356_Ps1]